MLPLHGESCTRASSSRTRTQGFMKQWKSCSPLSSGSSTSSPSAGFSIYSTTKAGRHSKRKGLTTLKTARASSVSPPEKSNMKSRWSASKTIVYLFCMEALCSSRTSQTTTRGTTTCQGRARSSNKAFSRSSCKNQSSVIIHR